MGEEVNVGTRVQWTGPRGAVRQGTVERAFEHVAEIRTSKGGYTTKHYEDLEVIE